MMEPLYRHEGVEERWQRTWEDEGLYRADATRPGDAYVIARAAAERDGRAAHGARAQRLDPGRAHSLAPHARLQHALAAGLRPRRHRDAGSGREGAAQAGHLAARDRPRSLRRARVGVAARVRRRDHGAVQAPRLLARLRARALHDGRRLYPRRDALLRASVRARLAVPRQPHRQLVQRLPHLDLGPRGRAHRGRRRAHLRPLSACRRQRRHHGRHRAACDHPGRRGRRGEPRRRALSRPHRQGRDRAGRSGAMCR